MPDREKVIRGLEICKADLLSRETCKITGCPYADIPDGTTEYKSCRIKMMTDAVALLKEHEPRVMTLDEIIGKTRDDVVYLEHMDGGLICQPAIPLGNSPWDDAYLNFAAGWRTSGSYQKKNYGETWRCWTSRPTDEQRREAAWG